MEIKAASEACHLMAGLRMPLWYAVIADRHRQERELRDIVREFKCDIVQNQRQADCPGYWVEIGEGHPAYHSNLLFPMGLGDVAQRLVDRLGRGKLFRDEPDLLKLQRAEDDPQWFVGYCAKERTTQARFVAGQRLAGRLPGSHPLGVGGGDRLRLSKELTASLTAKGLIAPWKRVYASRALPPAPAPVVIPQERVPDPHGLFGPLPDQRRSSPPVGLPRPRLKLVVPQQIPLPIDRRPDAIDIMRGLGETHEAIAGRIGRSRAQTTNILNRQFGASRAVVRTVLRLAGERAAA